MLRIARFGGLLTYASSYAVPPGGAVQQVNLTCSLPGQLTSRGGSTLVTFDEGKGLPTGVVTQLFPAPGGVGKGDKLVMIDETGMVTVTQTVTDGGGGDNGGGGGESGVLSFVTSPSSQSVLVGDSVSFYANAQSTESPISYRWQSSDNGTRWDEVGTSQTLTFTAALADNGTRYRCVATTASLGPAYSLPATLAVMEPAPDTSWKPAATRSPQKIAFWNGQFVGADGEMSSDGMAWSAGNNFGLVPAFGNGLWAVVTYQLTPKTSTDGIVWSDHAYITGSDGIATNIVSFANGKFVTFLKPDLSGGQTVANVVPAHSTDGVSWPVGTVNGLVGTTSPSVRFDLSLVNSIAAGDSRSVAVGTGYKIVLINGGTESVLDRKTDKCIHSVNQETWVAATLPFAAEWLDVAYGNGRFVAVCGEANGATSTDGINWTALPLPAGVNCSCVAFGDGKWVAGGSPSQVAATSTDGLAWTASEELPVLKYWSDVAYGNNRFLLCATDGKDSLYSEG